ncbi:MAG: hypothetical protein SFX18_19885 [Pirellulales bacterium]|nr:hypothetical protein [Pirellulales bacterium]
MWLWKYKTDIFVIALIVSPLLLWFTMISLNKRSDFDPQRAVEITPAEYRTIYKDRHEHRFRYHGSDQDYDYFEEINDINFMFPSQKFWKVKIHGLHMQRFPYDGQRSEFTGRPQLN